MLSRKYFNEIWTGLNSGVSTFASWWRKLKCDRAPAQPTPVNAAALRPGSIGQDRAFVTCMTCLTLVYSASANSDRSLP